MKQLLKLQHTVERIRSETSPSLPALAINILMSLGMKSGLSKSDLVSQLDAPIGELNQCVQLLTTDQRTGLNCSGLLFEDRNNNLHLTERGNVLVSGLRCCVDN